MLSSGVENLAYEARRMMAATEKIIIGNDVVVTVVQISGDRVRLAFEAPHEVPIHREEVLRKMNKKHQHIEDMFETARKCKLYDFARDCWTDYAGRPTSQVAGA